MENSCQYNIYVVYLIYGNDCETSNESIKKNGWKLARISASHHIFVKEGYERPVPVPFHKGKDDNLGDFAKDILKEANINPNTLKEV